MPLKVFGHPRNKTHESDKSLQAALSGIKLLDTQPLGGGYSICVMLDKNYIDAELIALDDCQAILSPQ